MSHVITDLCTKCLSCPPVCPVSCIHPSEDDEGLEDVPQLYIDPEECIDCGACAPECPSDAIFSEEDLPAEKAEAVAENAAYYSAG